MSLNEVSCHLHMKGKKAELMEQKEQKDQRKRKILSLMMKKIELP